MICKMCFGNNILVNAHIIPASFYRYLKRSDIRPLEIHTNVRGEYKKKSHIGIYDKNILCKNCEKIFQRYDDYAQHILLPDFKEKHYILNNSGKKVGYNMENVNYDLLKLFFMSLLWRASVSIRKEFSRINVGPFEEALRSMIQDGNPGDENVFSVIVSRFDDYLGKNFLLDPHNEKFDGINFCRFYLGAGYRVFIKVDKRTLPKSNIFRFFILKPNHPLHITIHSLLPSSKELGVLKKVIKAKN